MPFGRHHRRPCFPAAPSSFPRLLVLLAFLSLAAAQAAAQTAPQLVSAVSRKAHAGVTS